MFGRTQALTLGANPKSVAVALELLTAIPQEVLEEEGHSDSAEPREQLHALLPQVINVSTNSPPTF